MPRFLIPVLLVCTVPLFASTYVVNDLGDGADITPGDDLCATSSVVCTLRAAIQEANAHAGDDTITFSVSGTITPATAYPAITSHITIDGTSAPGYTTAPVVAVHGAGAISTGFNFASGSQASLLVALKIHGFTNTAISIATGSITVQRCYIGPVGGGTPNNSGVVVTSSSSNARIGGNANGLGNVISGNTADGIVMAGTVHNVADNFIGVNADGTAALANGGVGIWVTNATSATIGGDAFGAENVISGNRLNGVIVAGGTSNIVAGNLIGLDVTGTFAVPNGFGVGIQGATNKLGTPATRNVISGNASGGASVDGAVVVNNIIGLNAAGSATVRNVGNGVSATGGAKIGTSVSGNVISGNSGDGIAATGNGIIIQNNIIGLDATGTIRLGNFRGINGNAFIGGTGISEGNTISGNGSEGIQASGAVQIYGNTIGLTLDRTAIRENAGNGITLQAASNARIGSPGAGMNVISGNTAHGVSIAPGSSTGVIIEGNRIGTDGTGTSDLGNALAGIFVGSGASTEIRGNLLSGNLIGVQLRGSGNARVYGNIIGRNAANTGAVPNSTGVLLDLFASGHTIGSVTLGPNTIASNDFDGITVETGGSSTFGANAIFANGDLGIDLMDDSVTPNDPLDADAGPNTLQNFPVIAAAVTSGSGSLIQGTLNSTPNATFTLRFFSSATADPSGFGEGEQYLGATDVVTDVNGNATFTWSGPALTIGHFVTATATGSGTSEFSAVNDVGATPAIHFSSSAYTTTEGTGSVVITIVRMGDLSATSTVDFATSPATATAGVDYVPASGTLTFNPNESSKTVVISIFDDPIDEPQEQFQITLTNPNTALIDAPSNAIVTISDDDALPSISIDDVTQNEGNSGTTPMTFTVRLTNPSSSTVSVEYTPANGTAVAPGDYSASPGTLVFPPGTLTQTIIADINGDLLVEPTETFSINLANATNAAIADNQGVGTIVDDDASIPTASSWGLIALAMVLAVIALRGLR